MERHHLVVPPALKARMVEVARQFRKEPTRSESLLWNALRGRRMLDLRFRRQQPIGPFIADFFCPQLNLIIEVDGAIHTTQAEKDRERQALLEECGYRVVRISADALEDNLTHTLDTLRTTIATFANNAPNTPPLSP